jgi:hypothetical protein
MRLEDFQVRAGYSRAQVFTVIEVMKYTEAQAYDLVDFMDAEGEHPDWSEYSNAQFRRHFREVEAWKKELQETGLKS